jgi:hypothetical protein
MARYNDLLNFPPFADVGARSGGFGPFHPDWATLVDAGPIPPYDRKLGWVFQHSFYIFLI